MEQPDTRSQHDQQDWLMVAEFEAEAEAGRAANRLQNEGIPSMIDQRAMNARFAVLVSALQRDEARRVLRDIPEEEVVDDKA
jgi:hypothetical protein